LCSHATEPRISIHLAAVADVPDVLTGPEIHIPRSAAADSNVKYILSKDRHLRQTEGIRHPPAEPKHGRARQDRASSGTRTSHSRAWRS